MTSHADAKTFLDEWHRIVAQRDLAALRTILHADVTMGPPLYWQKFADRDVVAHLLGIIVNTIDDFRYHREWCEGRELALEFTGRVGEIELQGIDLITLDDENRLVNLDVMLRPMNALATLQGIVAPQMMEFLKARPPAG